MTAVRGRVPGHRSARRDHMREWRRESLWLWPAIAAVAAWVGGDLAARDVRSFTLHQGLFPTNLDDARTLLATIATALLTFTGVVFSITLVALQMASTQYSPRVLRTFVRKPVTKLALSRSSPPLCTRLHCWPVWARRERPTRWRKVPWAWPTCS